MKTWITILFLSFVSISFGQDDRECTVDSLLTFAKTQLGTPYRYGTRNPNVSFDCSGFTSYVYNQFNITNSRTSKGYAALGTSVDLECAEPGDCILFSNTTPGSKVIGHVGIVVGNDENGVTFIHCASSKKNGGVIISHVNSAWYAQRFLQVRRLF